jgi:hypothetical protein
MDFGSVERCHATILVLCGYCKIEDMMLKKLERNKGNM